MPIVTHCGIGRIVMTTKARLATIEEIVMKMIEDMKALRKKNVELQQKVIITNNGSY